MASLKSDSNCKSFACLYRPANPTSVHLRQAGSDAYKGKTAENPEPVIRVLLADDYAILRSGLVRLLKNEPDIKVVGEANDGQEAIDLAQKLKPDVILMDISMPGVNGIEATRIIHRQLPGICVIGFSMSEDQELVLAMREAGAADFKIKGCDALELLSAIHDCVQ